MTVRELHDRLGRYLEVEGGDETVVIVTSDGGFPAKPTVPVRDFCFGFDWNKGKLMLYPERPVVTKDPKARRLWMWRNEFGENESRTPNERSVCKWRRSRRAPPSS